MTLSHARWSSRSSGGRRNESEERREKKTRRNETRRKARGYDPKEIEKGGEENEGENRADGERDEGIKPERELYPERNSPSRLARTYARSEEHADVRDSPARSLIPRSMYLRAMRRAGGLHACTRREYSRRAARNSRRSVAPRDVERRMHPRSLSRIDIYSFREETKLRLRSSERLWRLPAATYDSGTEPIPSRNARVFRRAPSK